MAEVMNMPSSESLDRRRDRKSEKSGDDESIPPPPPPPQSRRRDRDSRERRDDRDIEMNRNRDHHERNRSPPPRDRDRGDREREYKRRASPSPPPYRDRRHSSPPSSGREEKMEDMMVVVDVVALEAELDLDPTREVTKQFYCAIRTHCVRWSRFGYDYERNGAGGRPGYADERPHGRFVNRSSGPSESGDLKKYDFWYSECDWLLGMVNMDLAVKEILRDWDAGRGGFNDGSNTGSMQRVWDEGYYWVGDEIVEKEMDLMLVEKEGLMSYKQFIQELEDDILPAEAERRYQEYRSEYISTQKRAYFDAHKDEEWLKDKYHPTNLLTVIERRNEHAQKIAREFLQDLQSGTLDLGPGVSVVPTTKSGQASEPNSEDEADAGGKRRRHGRGPAKETDLVSAAPKAHPISSDPRRIQADIEQAQALVRRLDNEKGVGDNILWNLDHDKMDGHGGSMGPIIIKWGLTSVKGLEGIELLDTLLTYLWRIHGLDYYGLIETSEVKGLRHVRADSKSYDETSSTGSEWSKKVDLFWQGRLRGQDPLEIMTAKEKIDAAAAEALEPHVRKIRDEKYGWKYGCGAKGCTKLFHAAEFVQKHLRLKHTDLMMELTLKVREDLYHQNYMNDSNAPGGTPIMQQPMKEKAPQRRGRPAVSDIRNREERGSRNVHDRLERVNVERNENSPPTRDFQSNTEEQQEGNLNEPNYDNAYGGQGISFPSDMPPPPVLMPVPGAGPLGPFIPAPPEVAMRMLREQGGGPSPYEGNGRIGRNGPQVGVPPGPILSAGFLQDPRRLRSYQDLDAPDDEVTVIDYRSL
ncbi:hypothetical protein GIB67_035076 [Kingdonia uniflora]|uniref:C2H2-type domain-containing protein n=1 Tax=Kingdonia uniflora TaxID=39325 RepID=A0A7J7L1S2_9MAGN|nr:hypothetical protein GIB67_035076 [Kingdonia uniflora]